MAGDVLKVFFHNNDNNNNINKIQNSKITSVRVEIQMNYPNRLWWIVVVAWMDTDRPDKSNVVLCSHFVCHDTRCHYPYRHVWRLCQDRPIHSHLFDCEWKKGNKIYSMEFCANEVGIERRIQYSDKLHFPTASIRIVFIARHPARNLQSSGCCVVEKHPSAEMYNNNAPPGGNSLNPLAKNTNSWLIDGLYNKYLCGLSRYGRFSPFSKNPFEHCSLYGNLVAGLESCGPTLANWPCMPMPMLIIAWFDSFGSRSSVCSIRNMSMVSSENFACSQAEPTINISCSVSVICGDRSHGGVVNGLNLEPEPLIVKKCEVNQVQKCPQMTRAFEWHSWMGWLNELNRMNEWYWKNGREIVCLCVEVNEFYNEFWERMFTKWICYIKWHAIEWLIWMDGIRVYGNGVTVLCMTV